MLQKNDYKWSDVENVIHSILQYVLQYGSAVLKILQYAFCCIVSSQQTKIFSYNVALFECQKATRKEKKKRLKEEKEDEAHAKDIAMLQIKAYKNFLNVMLMYSFVC